MPTADVPAPEGEFVAALRQAVEEYMRAVDQWEAAYRKYYRLADPSGRIPNDMENEQRAYEQARKRLAALTPRARALSFKHGLRDPWTGLLRSSLGQYTPQDRDTPAISRAERAQAIECLILLAEANSDTSEPQPVLEEQRSWLRRILDKFI